jgi:Gpi18-like mannosyltransferase
MNSAISARPRLQAVIDISLTYGLFTVIVTMMGVIAAALLPHRPGIEIEPSFSGLFVDVWSRWDSLWYIGIASNGYTLQNAAFFPLYPTLIAALSRLGMPPTLAGRLIARVAFSAALAGLYDLVRTKYGRVTAFRSILYLALFPSAVFFAAAYTESLFLMLVVLSFHAGLREHWLWASIWAGLAALTRDVGILLVLPLAYEYARQRRTTARPIISLRSII